MINPKVVAGTTSVLSTSLFTLPAGPATVLFANAGTAATMYVGPGTNVSATSGFPVPSGLVQPVTVPIYPGCPQQTWSCVTASGSASLLLLISDPSGGTGTGTLG